MTSRNQDHTHSTFALFLMRIATAIVLLAVAVPAVAEEEEEEDGAPHIVISEDAGNIVIEELEIVPEAVSGSTVTIFLSDFDSGTGIFASRPLAGIFANDDIGFEAEGFPTAGDVNIEVTGVSTSDPNLLPFILFGGGTLTEAGNNINIGSAFDLHPLWGFAGTTLLASDFVGSATFDLLITDSTSTLGGSAPLTVILSTDPEDAFAAVIPEPASAMLLVGAGFAALAKRRRRM